jgi:hypothetical protein
VREKERERGREREKEREREGWGRTEGQRVVFVGLEKREEIEKDEPARKSIRVHSHIHSNTHQHIFTKSCKTKDIACLPRDMRHAQLCLASPNLPETNLS